MSLKIEEFLSELIIQVKNDSLSLEMKKNITNLFLMNELEKKGDLSKNNDDDNCILKYCIMGWYIYNSIGSSNSGDSGDLINSSNSSNSSNYSNSGDLINSSNSGDSGDSGDSSN